MSYASRLRPQFSVLSSVPLKRWTICSICVCRSATPCSLASGVPMAGVLFPAAQVGLVILPLMLFHQIQLVACALIAQRLRGEEE